MRILFVTSAMPSHFFAMAPFGWAARAAGHEVRVASPPGLVPVVSRSGLPTVPVGAELDFAAGYRGRQTGGSADPKLMFAAVAEAMVDDLVALARSWRPDLVVWEPTSFAGPVAAAALGVPSVRYLWGPDIVGRGTSGRDRLPEPVLALFDRYAGGLAGVPEWTTVDPCPPSVQLPTSGPWRHVRYVAHSTAARVDPAVLPPPDRPRVLVTLGMSVTDLVGQRAFLPPLVVRALAGEDVETLVALPAGQVAALTDGGGLPDNVRVVADCPLPVLLAQASVVVHHGGAGTLLSAVNAGVPQLILAQMPDLAFYGDRLAATGAGLRLGADVTEATVRDAVAGLRTDPGHRDAAADLRAEALRQPSPARLAAELLPAAIPSQEEPVS
ncbi:nucleotide disphospho-sugar-binding domain-containing protein [Plantactinospora sp. KBS50]|uniref:nucleotide disphospho-sugar-binding domain-containing protein n=1 Tax=Plantactinospora sp. KBS50 TaxID=2024580 RepID=UPI001E4BB740|nr:nucleotide disphospho-sugar-binding domain-containing protein [Plantactinospora sp. KBS50]